MTIPIPDRLKGLPEITADEVRKMTGEGRVVFEGKVVRSDALEALHGAVFRGVSVELTNCLIDGDLDLTQGPVVPVEKVEELSKKLKESLRDLTRGRKKILLMREPMAIEEFPQELRERSIGALRDVKMVVLVKGSLIIEDSFIVGRVLAERVAFLNASFPRCDFKSMVSFWGAKFVAEASFEQATFGKGALFDGSHFVERADFEFATFEEEATFGGSTFVEWATFEFANFGHGPYFFQVTFGEGVSFDHATFREDAYFLGSTFEGPAVFRGRGVVEESNGTCQPEEAFLFMGDVNFAEVTFNAPEEVTFERVDLSRAFFRGTRLDRVRFIDVKWDERDGRRALYNERNVKKQDYELVAQLYRQLKKNYEDQRDYPGAGDFHYGEMEMTLKQQEKEYLEESKKWPKLKKGFAWFLTSSYKFLSGYGEKAERALIILLVILLAGVPFYSLGKLEVEPDIGYWAALWDGFVASLGYMTFRISQPPMALWAKPFMAIQAILGPVQLALTALALRRRFRR